MKTLLSLVLVSLLLTGCSGNAPTSSNNQAAEKHDDHSGHDHAEGEHPAHDDHSGHDHPEDENLPPHRH